MGLRGLLGRGCLGSRYFSEMVRGRNSGSWTNKEACYGFTFEISASESASFAMSSLLSELFAYGMLNVGCASNRSKAHTDSSPFAY